jgi:hypothetical protein
VLCFSFVCLRSVSCAQLLLVSLVMFLVKLGKSLVGGRGQNTYTWYVDQWLKYIILLIHVVCEPMVEIYYSSYSKYYVAVVTMATYVVVIVNRN